MGIPDFATLPRKATLQPQPFTASVPDQEIADFKELLRLSKLGPEVYENVAERKEFGVQREWLRLAKEKWASSFDWKKTEERINSFPNFTAPIEYGGDAFNVHFVALFSQKEDAVPVMLLHGWPGSFLEFLDVLDILRNKYSSADLPYNIVVPSLPGYAYSSGPPSSKSFGLNDQASILDALMVGLGFEEGYVAQGGDIGSFLSRILGTTSKHCKAVHLNFCTMKPPADWDPKTLSALEMGGLGRGQQFVASGAAYAMEHGTRPATIGLVLSSSPLALLAWIGEKFLDWCEQPPALETILDAVSLYWFTETFPRSIFPYRNNGSPPSTMHGSPENFLKVPMGYSYFPYDIAPSPISWVKTTGNLVWHRAHENGGHFAAMELPAVFVEDLGDFVAKLVEDDWRRMP